MDLQPTDDQLALIDMVTGFASDRFPIDVVRSFGEPNGFDRDRWTELAALGTFGLALPEGEGGVGLDFIDAVLVHEALGSALVPGPLLAATLSAGLVDGVLDGSVLPAIVDIPTTDRSWLNTFDHLMFFSWSTTTEYESPLPLMR